MRRTETYIGRETERKRDTDRSGESDRVEAEIGPTAEDGEDVQASSRMRVDGWKDGWMELYLVGEG